MTLRTRLMISALAGCATVGIVSAAAVPRTEFNAAATYKSKCTACHGPKADKKFNATMSDDDQVQAILKGKKAAKPPNMPAYGAKGITAANAKALVDYMKSLHQ
jgi:mono/diheme cytochrome c family protein